MKKIICSILVIVLSVFVLLPVTECRAAANTSGREEDEKDEKGYIEEHPELQGKVDAWIESASRDIVLHGNVQGKVNKSVQDTINGALKELGFEPGTYGNAIYKYVISHDTKGELLSAALEGDSDTMAMKTTSLMTEYIVKKITNREGASTFVDIILDGATGENLAENGINLSKSVLKKVVPVIDITEKFSDVVRTTIDIWAGNTMEDIYKNYKEKAGDGSAISEDEWREFCIFNRAAFTVYKEKGMTDEQIREKFAERAANDNKIAKKKAELEKLTKVWDRDMLLNPDRNNYPRNWTLEDRLASLYRIRQTMITMFTKDGKLQKGSHHRSSDEEFLEEMEFYWVLYGVRNREAFYDWLENEGIIKKGTFDSLRKNKSSTDIREQKDENKDTVEKNELEGKYIWYLEDVVVESEPSGQSTYNENYSGEYTGSASSHLSHQEFNYDKDHQEADFYMNWSMPPAIAGTDEIISIDTSVHASGNTDLIFRDFLNVYCVEYKGEDTHMNYQNAWGDSEGDYGVSASSSENSGDDRSESRTVFGTLGEPYKDTRKTIVMSSDYSTTYFIYGCRMYDAESVEKAQDLLDKIAD